MKKEDVLGKLPDLDNVLTPHEREEVLEEMEVHEYRKNEPIYSEGDRPSHLLCLISGKVKIYKDGVGGRAQIVRVVNAVEYFGYRAAFSDENYVTAAAAFESSIIATIPIDLIRQLRYDDSCPVLSVFLKFCPCAKDDLAATAAGLVLPASAGICLGKERCAYR